MFKDRILLITGRTGSFGNAVSNRFLDTDIKEIRIFSRNEKKQDEMLNAMRNPIRMWKDRGYDWLNS